MMAGVSRSAGSQNDEKSNHCTNLADSQFLIECLCVHAFHHRRQGEDTMIAKEALEHDWRMLTRVTLARTIVAKCGAHSPCVRRVFGLDVFTLSLEQNCHTTSMLVMRCMGELSFF